MLNCTVNLKEYKKYLSEHHVWKMDDNKEKLAQRVASINARYSDTFLLKLMDNTKAFNAMLLEKMAKERKISKDRIDPTKDRIFDSLELPMTDHLCQYISNGCGGGYHSDKIFYYGEENRDNSVSEYLVEYFFGKHFNIEVRAGIREEYNDDDSVSVFPENSFHINGPVIEFEKIVAQNKKPNLHKLSNFHMAIKQLFKPNKTISDK